MTYLLDTDTCIHWLRAHQSVQQHIAALHPEDIAVSIVTVAELRYGADCSSHVIDRPILTRHSRLVFTTHDRGVFTTHDRPVFTTHRRLMFTRLAF